MDLVDKIESYHQRGLFVQLSKGRNYAILIKTLARPKHHEILLIRSSFDLNALVKIMTDKFG